MNKVSDPAELIELEAGFGVLRTQYGFGHDSIGSLREVHAVPADKLRAVVAGHHILRLAALVEIVVVGRPSVPTACHQRLVEA